MSGIAAPIASYTTGASFAKPFTTGASYATGASYTTGAYAKPFTTGASYTTGATSIAAPAYSYGAPAAVTTSTVAAPTMAAPYASSVAAPAAFAQALGSKVISPTPLSAYATAPYITKAPITTSYTSPGAVTGYSSANLLAMGTVIQERIVSMEECLASGMVRQELVEAGYQPAPVQGIEAAPGQEAVPRPPRVIIICTSADNMDGHPTGAWSEEVTGPFYTFADSGCEVFIVSVNGGKIPIDEGSLSEQFFTENDRRFQEENGLALLENAASINDVDLNDVECIFLAGGHGTCVDFPNGLAQLVTDAAAMGKVVGAVCHGPMGLLNAITQEGQPLLQGRQVCGFSNEEEKQVGLAEKVPFLLQNQIQDLGAEFVCGEPWSEFAIRDGALVTGQNPQSSVLAARLCLEAMGFTAQ